MNNIGHIAPFILEIPSPGAINAKIVAWVVQMDGPNPHQAVAISEKIDTSSQPIVWSIKTMYSSNYDLLEKNNVYNVFFNLNTV